MSVRRRRECPNCQVRFTTYERLEQPRLMVIKKDGTRELFDRSKMGVGIYKAFYKRSIPAAEIEKLIDVIEREVYELNADEVVSKQLGEIVMKQIERLDQVAYIRFASVYREFTNLETFETEIKRLINKNKQAEVANTYFAASSTSAFSQPPQIFGSATAGSMNSGTSGSSAPSLAST